MKKHLLKFAAVSMIIISVISCRTEGDQNESEVLTDEQVEQSKQANSAQDNKELENTQLVESGTYTGEAIIVDSEQKEVYVKLNDTTTIELYFSNETRIMQNDQTVGFEALQKGQRVEVEVERSGESLKPKTVRILG